MKTKNTFLLVALALSLIFVSCNKSDNNMETSDVSSTITIKNTTQVKDYAQSGAFQGTGTPPLIHPGQSIDIKFSAGNGQTLAFATMYGLSKDWFFAPINPGLKLYDESKQPIVGDVSDQIKLWDNGTKDDVTGNDESKVIAEVAGVNAALLMKLDLSFDTEKSEFTLKITNTSGGTTHETPFSPGVWAVSNIVGGKLLNSNPFFEANKISNPEITAIAEGGDNAPASTKTISNTGIITGLSQLLVVAYNGIDNPIFKVDTKDSGKGLKNIAELGDADALAAYLRTLPGVTNVSVIGSTPILPGVEITGDIKGIRGDKISIVSMFTYSNDWFFANSEDILISTKGELASKIKLYDNGTAMSQFPGAGNAQGIFGGTPILEDLNIKEVGSQFMVLEPNNYISVSLK